MKRRLATSFVACAIALLSSSVARAEKIRVVVPDNDNLQYMSFWLADGAKLFADEGIEIEVVAPPRPQLAADLVRKGETDVYVLPPPMYLELIAERVPIALVANLLKNDPIALIVQGAVFDARHMSKDAPVADRLRSLEGLKIGVAPHPPKRLRALFATAGLDADKDISMVILHGPEQNAAFGEQKVDALYAHTPYLETAIVDQGARILVDQPGGDVPSLASRQIHALVVSRRLLEASPTTIERLVRAVSRAEKLVHDDPSAAVQGLANEFPKMDRRRIETIVKIYAPAIPASPEVSVAGLAPALALFPAGREAPKLDGIDLAPFVSNDAALRAVAPKTPLGGRWIFALVGAFVALFLVWKRARGASAKAAPAAASNDSSTSR